MKKLLILSGKGGTGKTTVAAAFIEFAKAKAFADCDVDAPNLHIISHLDTNPTHKDYIGSQKAIISQELCIKCGTCLKNCRFDAIEKSNGNFVVNEYACEGCAVCTIKCPVNAISMVDDVAGKLTLYKGNKTFSTAKLKMGRGNSGKLVTEVKNQLSQNVSIDTKIAIIDGSPGIGCPVIASISGVDMVLIVAEPSLSGISDMERIIKTCSLFGVKIAVCVNKYDVCKEITLKIKNFCSENKIEFVGRIPYDKNVTIAVNSGKNIASIDCKAREALYGIFQKTINILKSN